MFSGGLAAWLAAEGYEVKMKLGFWVVCSKVEYGIRSLILGCLLSMVICYGNLKTWVVFVVDEDEEGVPLFPGSRRSPSPQIYVF